MGLGGLLLDLEPWRRRQAATSPSGRGAAPSTGMGGAAPGFFDALADQRHEALFGDSLYWPRHPEGFRAEDVTGQEELEGFVPLAKCARRMEISEEAVLELARSGYLLARRARGRLLIRPGIL
jgi:hypothetical protein